MKKLMIFTTDLYMGGVANSTSKIIRTLSSQYDIRVVVYERLPVNYEIGDVDTSFLGYPLVAEYGDNIKLRKLMRIICLPLAMLKFFYYLLKYRPNVVYSLMYIPNVINVIFSKIFGYKAILSERQNPYLDLKGREIESRVFRYIFPMADVIHSNSKGIKEEVQRYYGIEEEAVHHVYNFFNQNYIKTKAEESRASTARDIVWVGRIGKQKGWEHFLRIINNMNESGILISVTVIGDGPDMPKMREMASELKLTNVEFTGHLKNPYGIMASSAMLLMTSEWESFGNVLVEGMMLGLGVACFDCDYGPGEIVDGGRFGELISIKGMLESPDSESYAEFVNCAARQVEKVLSNEGKYQKLALEGSKRFSEEAIRTELIEMIEAA